MLHLRCTVLCFDDDNELFLWYRWRKKFSLISSWDQFIQRFSPSRIANAPPAEFEPAYNLSSDLDEWCCAVVITTLPLATLYYIRHIQDSGMFRTCLFRYSQAFPSYLASLMHIHAYWGTIKASSGLFRHIQDPV